MYVNYIGGATMGSIDGYVFTTIALGQTETICEDGTEIRTVGKARPWVLELIPSLVDRRPNNSGIRI